MTTAKPTTLSTRQIIASGVETTVLVLGNSVALRVDLSPSRNVSAISAGSYLSVWDDGRLLFSIWAAAWTSRVTYDEAAGELHAYVRGRA